MEGESMPINPFMISAPSYVAAGVRREYGVFFQGPNGEKQFYHKHQSYRVGLQASGRSLAPQTGKTVVRKSRGVGVAVMLQRFCLPVVLIHLCFHALI